MPTKNLSAMTKNLPAMSKCKKCQNEKKNVKHTNVNCKKEIYKIEIKADFGAIVTPRNRLFYLLEKTVIEQKVH